MRNRSFRYLFAAAALAVLGGAGIGLASPPPPPPDPGCVGSINVCHGNGPCEGKINICPNAEKCKADSINVCKGEDVEQGVGGAR